MKGTLTANRQVLMEGTEVVIRPICLEDAPRLLEMHQRLSPDSIYYRYLNPYRPTLNDMRRLEGIHGRNGSVLVAAEKGSQEHIVGMACYVYESAGNGEKTGQAKTAEWAILVEDAFQGRGVGSMLLHCLILQAIADNVRTLHAETHPDNRKVMRLIGHTNMPIECKMAGGVREVDLQLEPFPEPASSLAAC